MSCSICNKKFNLIHKKAGKDGKCWSCLRYACAQCAPQYDGSELGWVTPHAVCSKCSLQLDRQKAKMSKVLTANPTPVIPSSPGNWTLTHDTKTVDAATASTMQTTPVAPVVADPSPAPAVVAQKASAVPSRLLEPGANRAEARRASRVLLQTVLENYKDMGNTPARNATSERRGDPASDGESESDDIGTPTPQRRQQRKSEVQTPDISPIAASHTPEASVNVATPATFAPVGRVGQLTQQELDERNARLSDGIMSSLDALSEASKKLGESFAAPTVVAEDAVLEEALKPTAKPYSAADFDAEFEKELAGLDAILNRSSTGHDSTLGTIDAVKSEPMRQVATPAATKVERQFHSDMGALSDDALMSAIDSLDSVVVSKDTAKAIRADPRNLESVGEALTQIASSVDARNPEASVALHEDIIEVIAEVRKEEQDAKLTSMLDGLELKVKESLAKAQTPKAVRKQRADAKFKVGQTVAARNRGDGSWHPASVKETDGFKYVVHWLADGKSQVCDESDLREFFVGSSVDAQCATANHAWLPAVVEYHTLQGDYRVRFLHDSSTQLCAPSSVRKSASAAHVQNTLQLPPNELVPLGKRCLDVILSTLNENKRAVIEKGVQDRKGLLVVAQVTRHLRLMFEQPPAQVPVFELKLGAVNSGTDETYTKLLNTILDSIDYLSGKFISLHKIIEAPNVDKEKLSQVVSKVQRLHVWLANVTARIKSL